MASDDKGNGQSTGPASDKPTWRKMTLWGIPLAAAAVFFVGGIIFWGGFNTAMEATNTMPFCISCHEMKDNVYKEYRTTIHYQNRTGVQAKCSDCHVPDPWIHKVVRKIQASNEVFHHLLGSIDTPEKFDKKRLKLAKNVWHQMKATDSRECRNCHTLESMNPEFQRPRARKQHLAAMKAGNTCIDCHKGIAHKNVRDKLTDEELEKLEAPLQADVKKIPETYIEGLKRVEAREAEEEAKVQKAKAAADAAVAERIKSAVAVATKKLEAQFAADKAEASASSDNKSETKVAAGTTAPAGGASESAGSSAGGAIDWSGIQSKTVTLFYPGQASFEWVQNGRDHGGARAFRKAGDRCAECHAKEVKDMGAKIVSGEKAEATPIPNKRAFVDVDVQSAYDSENIHFRFKWQNGAHTPVPFVEGGKMDPANETKLAIMFAGDGVEYGEQAGCWVSCHNDSRYMPDAPKPEALAASPAKDVIDMKDGLTKYLGESRTKIEIRGRGGKPRGGGDKLKSADELAELKSKGAFMDLLRYRSGESAENGAIMAERLMSGGIETTATGKREGDTWTVVISRPLKSDKPGDISIEPGKLYTMSIALHDDYTSARFHHVSLEMRFGIEAADAEIVSVKQ
jgi:nitrate/TMAO reductase-like tetraheme cytochrome c subunit